MATRETARPGVPRLVRAHDLPAPSQRGGPRGPRMTALARRETRPSGGYVQDADGNSYQLDHSGKPRLVLQESAMNDRVNSNLMKAARALRDR